MVLNASSLTDRQLKQLRDFAANGGTVYLSGHVGSCNNIGDYRKTWPFADIFGFQLHIPVKTAKTGELEYKGESCKTVEPLIFTVLDMLKGSRATMLVSAVVGKDKLPVVFSAPWGKGQFIYSAIQFGAALVENEQTSQQKYAFNPDPALRRFYGKFLQDQFASKAILQPVAIPENIMTSLSHTRINDKPALAVHFLNGNGAVIAFGAAIPSAMPPNPWPRPDGDLIFKLKTAAITEAYAVSPDFSGRKTVEFKNSAPGEWQFTVPRDYLSSYLIVFVR